MHARAASENCETRRSHSELVRAVPGQQVSDGAGSKSVDLYSSEAKLIRVPKEAYLKSHPRNTPLVTAHRQSTFCSGTDAAAGGNERVQHTLSPRRRLNETEAAPALCNNADAALRRQNKEAPAL